MFTKMSVTLTYKFNTIGPDCSRLIASYLLIVDLENFICSNRSIRNSMKTFRCNQQTSNLNFIWISTNCIVNNIEKLIKSRSWNFITHLTFGHDFDQPINHLPNSITHLTFGHDFDQPIDHL